MSIRLYLWLFYGALFAWLLCPDFLFSFLVWLVEDHSFRGPVVFGIALGLVFSIAEIVRGVKQFSVGYLFLIVLGLALLALAYLVCGYYSFSLEAMPPGRAARLIRGLIGTAASFLTAGIIPTAISRFWRRPS